MLYIYINIYLLIPPKLLLQFITLMVRAIILVSFCLPSTVRLCLSTRYCTGRQFCLPGIFRQCTRYWQTVYQVMADSLPGTGRLSTCYWYIVYQVLADSVPGNGRLSARYWQTVYQVVSDSLPGTGRLSTCYWYIVYQVLADRIPALPRDLSKSALTGCCLRRRSTGCQFDRICGRVSQIKLKSS